MLTLYITRHGETEWNTEKRMQGWSDSSLTKKGTEHAALLGNRLRKVEFDAIYSSPSQRTEMTAAILKGDKDSPIILDERLREIHMGIWEGETISHIQEQYPDEFHSFWNAPHLYQPLGGERFDEVKDRVLNFISSLRESHKSGDLLLVTHSVVIKILLAYFKDRPLKRLWDPPFIHDTSLTVVELWEEGCEIVMEGDLAHREITS